MGGTGGVEERAELAVGEVAGDEDEEGVEGGRGLLGEFRAEGGGVRDGELLDLELGLEGVVLPDFLDRDERRGGGAVLAADEAQLAGLGEAPLAVAPLLLREEGLVVGEALGRGVDAEADLLVVHGAEEPRGDAEAAAGDGVVPGEGEDGVRRLLLAQPAQRGDRLGGRERGGAVEGEAPGLVSRIARGDLAEKWEGFLDTADPFTGLPLRDILKGAVNGGRDEAVQEVYRRFVKEAGLSGQYGRVTLAPPRGASSFDARAVSANGKTVYDSREGLEREYVRLSQDRGVDPEERRKKMDEIKSAIAEHRYAR